AQLVQVMMVEDAGDHAAGRGVLTEVREDTVNLIVPAVAVAVLDAQLIAIGLADGTVLIGPGVPDMAVQFVDIVGLLLPDPEKFIDAGLEVSPAKGHDGEFFLQVVAIYDAESLDRMGRRAVRPL